jgi:hypothetical protein
MRQSSELGRSDGQRQKQSSKDCMRFKQEFPTFSHWEAYVRGFYRSLGYAGSGNRGLRKTLGQH